MRNNEYNVYFSLSGEFDPALVTSRLGIDPSRSWRSGDVNVMSQLERTSSRWCLDARDKEASLELQAADVLDQLRPHELEIRALSEEFSGVLQFVGYFHVSYPGFGLSSSLVNELSRLNLEIDCDFYYLYSDKREDS